MLRDLDNKTVNVVQPQDTRLLEGMLRLEGMNENARERYKKAKREGKPSAGEKGSGAGA